MRFRSRITPRPCECWKNAAMFAKAACARAPSKTGRFATNCCSPLTKHYEEDLFRRLSVLVDGHGSYRAAGLGCARCEVTGAVLCVDRRQHHARPGAGGQSAEQLALVG